MFVSSDSIDVTEHLLCLAKVKRFSMIIMLMSDKEKSGMFYFIYGLSIDMSQKYMKLLHHFF